MRREVGGIVAIVAAQLVWAWGAAAQDPPVPLEEPATLPAFDAYGNPQPDLPERRPLGLPDVSSRPAVAREQPMYLFDYSPPGPVALQRGGYRPFALMGDLLNLPGYQSRGYQRITTPESRLLTPAKRSALRRYGGFGKRQSPQAPGMYEALARRHGLISATSLNAPVYRARMGGGVSVSTSVGNQIEPAASGVVTIGATTLGSRLSSNVETQRARAKNEGWAAFREGEYRRAAREFETVSSIDPTDTEAKTAEIFCHVLTGSFQTAFTLLDQFRRGGGLFSNPLHMEERFGHPEEARRLIVRAVTATNATETSEGTKALYTFLLWHLDRREEALASAKELARRGSRNYGQWWIEMISVPVDAGGGRENESSAN